MHSSNIIAPQLVDKHSYAHSQGHLEKNHSRFSPEPVSAAAADDGVASQGDTKVPAVRQEAKLDVLPVRTVCLDFTQMQHTGFSKRIISPIP